MRYTIASLLLAATALPQPALSQIDDSPAGRSIAWQVDASADARVISGVVFAASGAPLHGAQVFLTGSGGGALTDDTGRFQLLAAPQGAWELQVQYIGYHTARAAIQIPEDAGVFVTAVLRDFHAPLCGNIVCAGGSGCKDLNVVVVDSITGQPPEVGVRLRVEHDDSVWIRQFRAEDLVARRGIGLGMPITSAGEYDIEVTAEGYHAWRREDIHLRLPDGCHPVLLNRKQMVRLIPRQR